MDFSHVDLILLGLEKGLTAREIADQLGMDEHVINEMREAVRLSEYSLNHALAPVLEY